MKQVNRHVTWQNMPFIVVGSIIGMITSLVIAPIFKLLLLPICALLGDTVGTIVYKFWMTYEVIIWNGGILITFIWAAAWLLQRGVFVWSHNHVLEAPLRTVWNFLSDLFTFLYYLIPIVSIYFIARSTSGDQLAFVIISGIAAVPIAKALHVDLPQKVALRVQDLHRQLLRGKGWNVLKRVFKYGQGGSSSWASVKDAKPLELSIESTSNQGYTVDYPLLGRTLLIDDYEPRFICDKGDIHRITIGLTGSGKSTSVLLPHLAMNKTSTYVFDPKGELALATFDRRNGKGKASNPDHPTFSDHSCFLFDPFNITQGKIETTHFNPLSVVDIDTPHGIELVAIIVDSIIPNGSSDNSTSRHFTSLTRAILSGLIVYVMDTYEKQNHNLPFVLDFFLGSYYTEEDLTLENGKRIKSIDRLAIDLSANNHPSNLCRLAGQALTEMGDDERGSFITTFSPALIWIADENMKASLMGSDPTQTPFYKVENKTVYYALPEDKMKTHYKWARVCMQMFYQLEKWERETKPKVDDLLFIVDEFKLLGGRVDMITEGLTFFRGQKVRLWLFFQNMAQLKEIFGKEADSAISSSIIQVFGVNDQLTARFVSEIAGQHLSANNRAVPLMTTTEVMEEFSKDSPMQFVKIPECGKPFRLYRHTFKPLFSKDGKRIGVPLNSAGIDLSGHFAEN